MNESTNLEIPLLDLGPEIEMLWDEINKALQNVLRSGRFIMGPDVYQFEKDAASYLGINHAVGLNSGTDALVIGLKAAGIVPEDEVITTSFSFFATAEAISQVGARPVFVDIDPVTFNIDPGKIEAKINDRTRALLPVHLYGHAADMDPILSLAQKHNLVVVEDTAQAFGGMYRDRKLGTIGHCGAYSFFPSKNLGAYGDAGMLVTNDPRLVEMASMLRVHGAKRKYENEMIGFNSRMDTLQAAILTVKLKYIDRFNELRRSVADRYTDMLGSLPDIVVPEEVYPAHHVYHQYTIRITNGKRDNVRQALKSAGITTMVYYPIPIHKLPSYAEQKAQLPECERAAEEVLSLPIWPQITADIQERVVTALQQALNKA